MKLATYFFLSLLLLPMAAGAALNLPVRRTWEIDGVARTALVYAPSAPSSNGAPLVLVFHGHGGTAGHAAWSFGLQKLWPEALVVYPQGLLTPGQITDP